MEKLLAILAYLAGIVLVAWMCERYKPLVVLGGILLLIVVLT